jgi:pilus assembly protein Flp/PilA
VNTARFVSRLVQSKPVAPIRLFHAINKAQAFLGDEDGVTSMEYALIATLIAMVIIGTVTVAGTNLNTLFSDVATSV